jgi:hypothetical protein
MKVGVFPAHSIKYFIRQAVHQVVFIDVLIVGRLNADGHSFALIGFHKIGFAFDWLLIKHHCIGTKDLPGVQLQNKSDYIGYQRDFCIYRKEDDLFQLKARGASKNSKNSRNPY